MCKEVSCKTRGHSLTTNCQTFYKEIHTSDLQTADIISSDTELAKHDYLKCHREKQVGQLSHFANQKD